MHDFILDLDGEAATCRLGTAIGRRLVTGDTVLLDGPLGAGKTVLARAILRTACHDPGLEVPSPSYTLLQDYESPMGVITHFDLWRLDGPRALAELDWRGAREGVVIVEWPDRLADARPTDALAITLSAAGDARRARVAGWPPERLADLVVVAAGGCDR